MGVLAGALHLGQQAVLFTFGCFSFTSLESGIGTFEAGRRLRCSLGHGNQQCLVRSYDEWQWVIGTGSARR